MAQHPVAHPVELRGRDAQHRRQYRQRGLLAEPRLHQCAVAAHMAQRPVGRRRGAGGRGIGGHQPAQHHRQVQQRGVQRQVAPGPLAVELGAQPGHGIRHHRRGIGHIGHRSGARTSSQISRRPQRQPLWHRPQQPGRQRRRALQQPRQVRLQHGDDGALDVGRKTKTMRHQRRQQQQAGAHQGLRATVQPGCRRAVRDVQNLQQRGMAVRPDLPIVLLAALGNALAVQPLHGFGAPRLTVQRVGGQRCRRRGGRGGNAPGAGISLWHRHVRIVQMFAASVH